MFQFVMTSRFHVLVLATSSRQMCDHAKQAQSFPGFIHAWPGSTINQQPFEQRAFSDVRTKNPARVE